MLWSGFTGERRYLVEYEHHGTVVDLDDSSFLAEHGYRPSDIVARNRTRTQEIALELWLEGIRTLKWWSYHRPEWRILSTWHPLDEPKPWNDTIEVISTTELTIDHPAIIVAADVLRRTTN